MNDTSRAPRSAVPRIDITCPPPDFGTGPAVITGLDDLASIDVFDLYSRIGEAVRTGTHRRPQDVRLFCVPDTDVPVGQTMPAPGVDFAGYTGAVTRTLSGAGWSVIANSAQAYSPQLYRLAREIFVGLRGVGRGLHAGISDCFVVCGAYESGPTRIHKDTADVLLYVAEGVKTMLLWPFDDLADRVPDGADAAHDYVALGLRPDDVGAAPVRITAGPGEALYWPSRFWHCAESDGTPSLTLHLAAHRWRDLGPVWDGAFRRAGVGDHAARWTDTERALHDVHLEFASTAAATASSAVQQWMLTRHSTANFEILPDLRPAPAPDGGGSRVRALQSSPVSWGVDVSAMDQVVVAANGRSLRVPRSSAALDVLARLERLGIGESTDVEGTGVDASTAAIMELLVSAGAATLG